MKYRPLPPLPTCSQEILGEGIQFFHGNVCNAMTTLKGFENSVDAFYEFSSLTHCFEISGVVGQMIFQLFVNNPETVHRSKNFRKKFLEMISIYIMNYIFRAYIKQKLSKQSKI